MTSIYTFIIRERRQTAHLVRALKSHHQKSFKCPTRALTPLSFEAIEQINAHSGYARRRYLRAVFREAKQMIRTSDAGNLREPAFLVTLIDADHALREEGMFPTDTLRHRFVSRTRGQYAEVLKGLNYFGMIDLALYVSARTALGVDRLLLPHAHVIVWGVSESALSV